MDRERERRVWGIVPHQTTFEKRNMGLNLDDDDYDLRTRVMFGEREVFRSTREGCGAP